MDLLATTAAAWGHPLSPLQLDQFDVYTAELRRWNERINLTGVYQGGEGARLQVQRFENGWVDFPVSTSVSGGSFTTYIYTGRSGPNRFRVIDKEADKASNPVRVSVG